MSGLSDAARRDWLRLARTENVGPVTFDQLIQRFGTAAAALAALPDLAQRGGRRITLASEAVVDKELADGARLGAQLIAALVELSLARRCELLPGGMVTA